jgi:opacity protein-like surface antigen
VELVGTGVEWAFTPNWSVKAEYDYLASGTGWSRSTINLATCRNSASTSACTS